MALKAFRVSDVLNVDQVLQKPNNISARYTQRFKFSKFVVIGHRGSGMNMLQASDPRMKSIRENSVASFNAAAQLPIDFIEFDVQVTKDERPVVFHDIFIVTKEKDNIVERRVTELTLVEFLSYGPQKEPNNVGKPLFRKEKDGQIFQWEVKRDDHLCSLEEVFQKVDHSVGFNIELKFDDQIVYREDELLRVLHVILKVVFQHGKDRPVVFSSFHPDAALLIRKLQNTYPGMPVFFLTKGGTEIYKDARRNSLEEAVKVSLAGGLQGIVSEVKAVIRNPNMVSRIKDSNLSLVTYGHLNNVPEVVLIQYLLGVDGVIVDLVKEITEAVSHFRSRKDKCTRTDEIDAEGEQVTSEEQIFEVTKEEKVSLTFKLVAQLTQ